MKIDMQRALAEELLTQIAALRDMEREKRGDTTEWDKSPLGLFFSMLTVELKRRSRASAPRAAAAANRRRVKTRFTR